MMALYIIAMQYRLVWDGYGKPAYSYYTYASSQNMYSVVDAKVVNTKKHILAGLDGIISCDMFYCTLCYEVDNITYEIFSEVFPDYKEGDIIKVAVYNSNPQIVERKEKYSIRNFHWGAEVAVIIFGVLLAKFTFMLKGLYSE